MILDIRRVFFRTCRSTLIAKVFKVEHPQLASQKDEKRESSCWTMLLSIDKVEDDGTECLFSVWNLIFPLFYDYSRRRFRCTIASILKQRTLQRLSFFFWGNLVFRLGMLFSTSVSKNITGAFLCDIGGNDGFSLRNSGGQSQFSTEFLR